MKKKQYRVVITALTAFALASIMVFAGCNKKDTAGSGGAGSGANSAADSGVKTVYAATGGMPKPFSYVDESGKLVGHNIELVEEIFKRLPQYRLVLEATDFPSIFAGLDADRYQLGVNNFAINEERKEKYLFSDPIFVNRYIAAVAADNTALGDEIKTLGDLAGKSTLNTVGTNMATAAENYNKAYPEAPIKLYYGDVDILVQLQQVESGQYDFNLLDKPMFDFYVRDFGLKLRGIELSPDVSSGLMQTPYSYILISRGNEQIAADINKALREIIADGTSKRICEKYFGSDYSPGL